MSWIVLIVVVVAFLQVIRTGLVYIPPPQKGILVFLGRRTRTILNEGYVLIFPLLQSVIKIDCSRKTEKLAIEKIFTPEDQAEIIVNIEITWQPSNLTLFYETKEPLEQLEGMIAEAIRGFAADPYTPPIEWEEAVGMSEKFGRMVVAKLMGYEIPRYSDGERKGKHKEEGDMSPEEKEHKEKTIAVFDRLKVGEGQLEIPGIGLVVQRFNIVSVEPSAGLARSLEKISEERQQQKAELVEADTNALLVKNFLLELGYSEEDINTPRKVNAALNDLGMDMKTILMIFRVERDKAKEVINQILLDGPGAKPVMDALSALAQKFGGN